MKVLVLFLFSSLCFGQYMGPVTLENFSSFRVNHNTDVSFSCTPSSQTGLFDNCLWPGQPNQNTVCGVTVLGQNDCTTQSPAINGLGTWLNTLSCDSTTCYGLLNSYMQSYIKSGTWYSQMNRLYWTYKCTTDITFPPPGHWLEMGMYTRNTADPNPSESGQGLHSYIFLNANSRAGQWVNVSMNRVIQHVVGLDANQNWCEDQSFTQCYGVIDGPGAIPTHYYDGLTHYYYGPTYAAELRPAGVTCSFGPVTLDYVQHEPDAYVSNITGTYDTSVGKYNVSWNTAKHVPSGVAFDVVYSLSELHVAGFNTGTSAGSTTGQDDSPYTTVNFVTPAVGHAATMYIGIRPHMDITTATSGIQLTTRVEHFLTTGDQVVVSGVCANANGTRTITVVDSFNFTIGASGACSYAGTGGRIVATSNTTNFAELNITPPSNTSGGSVSGGSQTFSGVSQ